MSIIDGLKFWLARQMVDLMLWVVMVFAFLALALWIGRKR